jgi:hypothetical protein
MTAVEWLFDNLDLSGGSEAIETLKQAKEMEKEQIIEAFNEGNRTVITTATEYYERTFKPE